MPGRSLVQRMKGAAFIDVATYEEVEADRGATGQAAAVVAMVAVAQAIGSSSGGLFNIVGAALGTLVGWLVWAGITYLIGAKLFKGTATWGELLRTLGFAQAPGVLAVFAIVPVLGWFVSIALFFWILVAGVVAVRQALDFGTGKAVATVILGWIVLVVIRALFQG